MFDPNRTPYSTAESAVTIWLTRNLALPDADDIESATHGGFDQSPRANCAGMAIYGLLVDTRTTTFVRTRDVYAR